jgi:N-acetyl-gamma-glutamyl-phosphate reductase
VNPPPTSTHLEAALSLEPAPTALRSEAVATAPESTPRPDTGIRARVAVVGASGYAGQEFTRLALTHPGLELITLSSREHAGRSISELLPGLDPRAAALPSVTDLAALDELAQAGAFDTLVVCLPHGAWKALAHERPVLTQAPLRIVDFSSDFRDGGDGYVYGLPEAFRAAIPSATRVANPGCYPTAATLALLPAVENGWLAGPIPISALSGVTGAGRGPSLRTSFAELEGGAAIYKAGTEHPHVAEIERTLGRLADGPVRVSFVPHLTPMARGILLTATAALAEPLTPEQVREAYRERYEGEPFVHLLEPGVWPETRAVRSSNRCDLAVTTLHEGHTLLVTAALDNLVKGAAGQAVQNLNLMLGWPEDWCLPLHGNPW